MSRILARLLDCDNPTFYISLADLEKSTHGEGVDVRLIADITHIAHAVMRKLGLDPSDTTPLELFRSLVAHVDDEHLFTDTDYVGLVFDGKVISFNREDVKQNTTNTFELSTHAHLTCSLEHEITERYTKHQLTNTRAVKKLFADAGLGRCELDDYHESKKKSGNPDKPYILSVGDIVTDAFIQLKQDEARIDTDEQGNKRLSMEFGNKPPYERVDILNGVGNSANASVAFSRLGIRTGLMGFIGDDQVGKDMKDALVAEAIDVTPLQISKGMKSNYHYVLRYGADRTILIKYEDYNYRWKQPETTPDWIYLSAISDRSWGLHQDMLGYLEENPDIKLAFQPGTYHFKWGSEKLRDIYRRSEIVFMNREEAADVTGRETRDIKDLAQGLHDMGVNTAIITDGPDGAYASVGDKLIKVPNYPDPAPPLDRTGAGDAFASTVVAALASGETIETALSWAPINSMSVVQKLGAQEGLLKLDEIKAYLDHAPDYYHAEVYY
ncbi:MAG: carbohydrate kinase family protein [Candidatus Saccharimonadaceae bacterium]